jgi:hypothetical protein
MITKTQLQNKIQELEAELQQFKEQLNNYKEYPTIQEANVGDVLEDGSIIVKKENGLALLVAPKSTEVCCKWSKEFPEVFNKLKEQGFYSSQWFIPTVEQLKDAYKNENVRNYFPGTLYWSSTEINATIAYFVDYSSGLACLSDKTIASLVRAFRCVTY